MFFNMIPPSFITEFNGIWLLSGDTYIHPAVKECGQLNWDRIFQSVLDKIIEPGRNGTDPRIEKLTAENARMKGVIAEVIAENLDLKKTLSD